MSEAQIAAALFWSGSGLALVGALLTAAGAIGVLRFPDFFTRIHAASVTDTGGATLMILGLMLVSGFAIETLKLLITWAFIMLTSPTASHALANAAYSSGLRPRIGAWKIARAGASVIGEAGR